MVQLDCTRTIAACMGHRVHTRTCWSLVLVIGAAHGQRHKNPIVAIIVGSERFGKVVPCSETGGASHFAEFLALTACFKPPPKRQLSSFNVSTVGCH